MTRKIMSAVRRSILCAFSCSSWMWNMNEVICRSGSFRMKVLSVTFLFPVGCLLFLHLFSREDSSQPSLHGVVVHVYVFMLRHRRRTSAWSHGVLSAPVTVRAEGSCQSWSDSLRRRDAFAPLSVWTLRSALLGLVSSVRRAERGCCATPEAGSRPPHTHKPVFMRGRMCSTHTHFGLDD